MEQKRARHTDAEPQRSPRRLGRGWCCHTKEKLFDFSPFVGTAQSGVTSRVKALARHKAQRGRSPLRALPYRTTSHHSTALYITSHCSLYLAHTTAQSHSSKLPHFANMNILGVGLRGLQVCDRIARAH
jgi:hypothetical protein